MIRPIPAKRTYDSFAASQLVADLTLQRSVDMAGDVLAALTPDRLRA